MVHYVECGTDFILSFGDAYEQYYMSLESVFDNVIKMIKQNDAKAMQKFVDRLRIVVKKAEPVGWGYYDAISEIFDQAYPEC